MLNVGRLQSNLQEIYSAIHNQYPSITNGEPEQKRAQETVRLVASVWGRVYDPDSGWGRLWSLYYFFLRICCGTKYQDRKVRDALQGLLLDYSKCIAKLDGVMQQYGNYLRQKLQSPEDRIEPNLVSKERDQLRIWHHATSEFLKLWSQNPARITALFQAYLPPETTFSFDPAPIGVLRNYYNIISLESLSPGNIPPLPIFYLAQMVKKERDEKNYSAGKPVIEKWLESINHKSSAVRVGDWHRVWREGMYSLVECADLLGPAEGPAPQRVITVEMQRLRALDLEQQLIDIPCVQGCKNACLQVNAQDKEHLAWRATLKPGRTLYLNGRSIVLGEQIKPKQGFDNNLVFTISENPKEVVLIGKNLLSLGLKYRDTMALSSSQQSLQLVPVLKIKEVDSQGRFAIAEKMDSSLNAMKWDEDDNVLRHQCGPVIAIIRNIVDNPSAAMQLSVENLGFDRGFNLVSTKPLRYGPLNFDALKEFLYAVANGNVTAFALMMRNSGLFKDKVGRFYKEVVASTLDDPNYLNSLEKSENEEKLRKSTLPYDITVDSSQVIVNALKLNDLIRKEFQRWCEKLALKYPKKNKKHIEENVKAVIKEAYVQLGGGTDIWGGVLERVILDRIRGIA